MEKKIFTYPFIVQETFLDIFGHINNAMYLTLYEQARWELITKNGYGLERIQKSGFGPVILEIKLSFLKELKCREAVTIETEMLTYVRKIGHLKQQMVREGEVCSTAEVMFGLFDIHQRKLVLPTPEWSAAMGMSKT